MVSQVWPQEKLRKKHLLHSQVLVTGSVETMQGHVGKTPEWAGGRRQEGVV